MYLQNLDQVDEAALGHVLGDDLGDLLADGSHLGGLGVGGVLDLALLLLGEGDGELQTDMETGEG